MKLRARTSRKKQTTVVQYYVQYDRMTAPPTQVDMNYSRPSYDSAEAVLDGPYVIQKIESRVVLAMNRLDVVPGSVRIVEKRVDGPIRKRTAAQASSAA